MDNTANRVSKECKNEFTKKILNRINFKNLLFVLVGAIFSVTWYILKVLFYFLLGAITESDDHQMKSKKKLYVNPVDDIDNFGEETVYTDSPLERSTDY